MKHHRQLDDEDYIRMNLPAALWGARLRSVPASILQEVQRYCSCDTINLNISKGLGFFMCGKDGVGKTGAAVVLAKAARCHYHAVYFTTISDLREASRSRVFFDAEQSISERCRTVPFLVLDGLRQEDAEANYTNGEVNAISIGRLVESRSLHLRPTILTATLPPAQLKQLFPMMAHVASGKNKVLSVTGPNLLGSV